ncbi:hypothetical protein [Allochromatium vinosum]|uniref:Uncharacterized protein n=1 Tax=Allochromatium vinosum (strain ATCC 17899 / DSM 180 / NBRC 103801 / NCIMB 10441 / D) TaxID=572477 RepID=D3RW80_ALLVD|nr:hypothetical protein [Allochromatium vinosum]ADC64092.1 hypothetical protein Alvin_3195 [Allochromatium vinosum DSM 180]
MSKQPYFITEIDTRVSGIPCLIGVESYSHYSPDPNAIWSDWDYLGHTESDWRILDRRGRIAEWLECKMTAHDKARIEHEIDSYMEREAKDRRTESAIMRYLDRRCW